MLWMLAQLYEALPEAGDLPKPKLAFFFDEAHLLFDDASKALLDQVERTVRLIRSKGVGVYFVTQVPTDVPSSVLAQLGNRVQHALRVFTPEDADNLKKTVRTFPMTDYFDVGQTIMSLGTGEALVTVLSPRGVPTPLAPTRLVPPDSLMAAIPPAEMERRISAGSLYSTYAAPIDRESAHEILSARLAAAKAAMVGATGAPGATGHDARPGTTGHRGPRPRAGARPPRCRAPGEGRRSRARAPGRGRSTGGRAGGEAPGGHDRGDRRRSDPGRLRDALRAVRTPAPLRRTAPGYSTLTPSAPSSAGG